MARKFGNFVKRLKKYDISVLTSLEDFLDALDTDKHPPLQLKCSEGHIFSLKISSLYNKFAEYKENEKFCAECAKPVISGEEQNLIDKCGELGLEFLGYEKPTRRITYKCVCGNLTTTHAGNILRPGRQAQCLKCQNNKFRNDVSQVAKTFEDAGCKLLSEYKSRHDPVRYKCVCGTVSTIRYADFVRGKRCKETCKHEKYKQTCQENFGVDNMFQAEHVKQKSRETCLEKYGVEHCMQSPAVFKKAQSSSYHRTKTVTMDGYKWEVQGYEPFCINDLLQAFEPFDIIAGKGSNVPSFTYRHKGKLSKWYPDAYIPSIDKIYEVKSTFTYNKSCERIKDKIEQCPRDCALVIYNRDGTIFEQITKDTLGIHYLYGDKVVLGEHI